jgi:hypothetical protein
LTRAAIIFAAFAVCGANAIRAQDTTPPCAPCYGKLPCTADTEFDVHLRDGTVLRNYRSIVRDLLPDRKTQAVHLHAWRNGHCTDVLVPVDSVSSIVTGGLGPMSSPFVLSVYPAREFSHGGAADTVSANFVEITALGGYAGQDTSGRAVGFKSFYEGAEALIAPFGTMLGDRMAFAFGGELLFEGGRMRIPAMGQLRYSLVGNANDEPSDKSVDYYTDSAEYYNDRPDSTLRSTVKTVGNVKYYENLWQFECPGPLPPPKGGFHEINQTGRKDSSVFLLHEKEQRGTFRPFVYIEGAYIFNGSFAGAGQNPSINPGDYGQYFFGGGIGTPFGGIFTASLGYRYMRLDLRTPCPTCVNQYIVNANISNSLMLKFGIRL